MALADPQSITIAGSAISLPRVNTGNNGSDYQSGDGLVHLSLSNQYGKRNRRVLRVDHSKLSADPAAALVGGKYSMSNYIVFDTPQVGYTNQQILDVWVGLSALATASSSAIVAKLLGGES